MTPYQQQAAAERSGRGDAVLEKAKSKRRHWAQENTLGMARRFSMAVVFLREAGRLPMITSCMAPRDASRRLYRRRPSKPDVLPQRFVMVLAEDILEGVHGAVLFGFRGTTFADGLGGAAGGRGRV